MPASICLRHVVMAFRNYYFEFIFFKHRRLLLGGEFGCSDGDCNFSPNRNLSSPRVWFLPGKFCFGVGFASTCRAYSQLYVILLSPSCYISAISPGFTPTSLSATRRFPCNICGKSYAKAFLLKNHIKSRHESKLFVMV